MLNTNLRFKQVKRTLERHKSVQYSNVPQSILDIQNAFKKPNVLNKYGFNYEGDARFYIDTVVSQNHAFTVFGSQFVIDFIKKNINPQSRKYVMDGTFGSIQNQFYQLFTITVEYMNNVSTFCTFSILRK